ncbi:trypsin, alkaline B-like isoform X2 [Leguminivora glycinivorella]|uniref:trypsin, alkaline B-like isoform X2 n=1 Tax=Leguminivora glycinivorella TaxID=1035111 RepID=UPI00200F2E88|nr:trypsin, alkaline B-like isoform X2 [Leguminivora glycinivorella]
MMAPGPRLVPLRVSMYRPENAGTRIIGGSPAPISRYPYTVQVLNSNQLSCGGTLITRRHVLSAAHCFVDSRNVLFSASLFSCRVGSATLNTGGSVYRVSRIINHERYNLDAPRDNDISVLLLSTTVTLSANVATATIPTQGSVVPDNAVVWVVGWGQTTAVPGPTSTILNEVWVYTINTAVCAQRYRNLEIVNNSPYPVTSSMMCSGILDVGGRDACQGDSGGPVIYSGVVVGVTSWGESCAHPYYPGVNARVAAYTNWINSTVTRYNGAPSLGQTSLVLLLLSFFASSAFSNHL